MDPYGVYSSQSQPNTWPESYFLQGPCDYTQLPYREQLLLGRVAYWQQPYPGTFRQEQLPAWAQEWPDGFHTPTLPCPPPPPDLPRAHQGLVAGGSSINHPTTVQSSTRRPVIAVGTSPWASLQHNSNSSINNNGREFPPNVHHLPPSAPNRPPRVPILRPPPSRPFTPVVASDDAALEEFGKKMLRFKCPKCGSQMIHDEATVMQQADHIVWAVASAMLEETTWPVAVPCCAPCPQCKVAVCMGCGRDQDRVLAMASGGVWLPMCCDDGRVPVLWIILCGLPSRTKASCSRQGSSQQPSATPPARGRGIGYGDGGKCAPALPSVAEKQRERRLEDARISLYFDVLGRVLPRRSMSSKSSPFVKHPPPIISVMLRRSRLTAEMAELLRNDSIEDMVLRNYAYEALLGLVGTLQAHVDLAGVLHGKRHDFPSHRRLLRATFPPKSTVPPGEPDPEPLQPLASLLEALARPAEYMWRHLQAQKFQEDHPAMHLCRKICQMAEWSSQQVTEHEGDDVHMGGTDMAESHEQKALTGWHRDNALTELSDEAVLSCHALGRRALSMAGKACRPGRMRKLVNEMAVLGSSLPSGIYVRYGTNRLDVIKVLIEGPRETPYEFGMFEFDMLCPLDYPQTPPMVSFRPKSPHSINPNLYPDGKVCLSLLGTWRGEAWNPQQSTLLQVLVSVQSMVLCEEPWCNEPGREADSGKVASMEYNSDVRGLVLQHYIGPWACRRQGLWAEVMERHLQANAGAMLRSAEAWFEASKAAASTHGRVRVDMEALRKALGGHNISTMNTTASLDSHGGASGETGRRG